MARGSCAGGLILIEVRTDDLHLPVFDLVHVLGGHPFDGVGSSSAALQIDVLAAHPLPFEGRTVGDRDGNRGDGDLQPSDLYGPLDDLVMRNIGDDVLIGADAGGEDLGDGSVCDGGESPVDGSGRVGIPFIGHKPQGHDEGEGTVLVVDQVLSKISGLDPSKGHGHTAGKSHGKDGSGDIGSEGNQTGRPADLNARLDQLFGETFPLVFGTHEDVEVLLLKFNGNLLGNFRGGCSADNGGKSRRRPIHEFNPSFAEDHVISGSQPDVIG